MPSIYFMRDINSGELYSTKYYESQLIEQLIILRKILSWRSSISAGFEFSQTLKRFSCCIISDYFVYIKSFILGLKFKMLHVNSFMIELTNSEQGNSIANITNRHSSLFFIMGYIRI